MGMSTLLCLVRHGESEWNRESRIQGQSDPALSELGLKQAEAVAERLAASEWDLLYSSDLARAYQTARAVSARLGLEIRLRSALRERFQGRLEGLLSEEARRLYPDFDAPEVGRESLAALKARAARGIGEVLAEGRGKRLIVVSHGGLIRAYLEHLMENGAPVTPVNPANTSVTLIQWRDGIPEVIALNDVRHLEGKELVRPG